MNTKITRQQFTAFCNKTWDILGLEVLANEYIEYILLLLFLKRISDVFEEENEFIVQNQIKSGKSVVDAMKIASDITFYPDTFFIPEKARWNYLKEQKQDIGSKLNEALLEIGRINPALEWVSSATNFSHKLNDGLWQKILNHFSAYRLRDEDFESKELLGDTFDYLIYAHISIQTRHTSEHYTPLELSSLIANLLKPEEGMSVYDPALGTGGLLIHARKYVTEHGGNPNDLYLHGEEINHDTWLLCQMNMFFHNVFCPNIKLTDTLKAPSFINDGQLMKFDLVISHPPFNVSGWYDEPNTPDKYGRYTYGIPPKHNGSFAFIQHMIASLKENGRMAVIVQNGVLFRHSSEKDIRKGILEDDLLEAVIALPSCLLPNTLIPISLLIINKDKAAERKNKILFIDATKDFQKDRNKAKLRTQDIEKISTTYISYLEINGYSKIESLDEIRSNDFNLYIIPKWEIKRQVSNLDTAYKKFQSIKLNEISIKANLCKANEEYEIEPNTIYVPKIGQSNIICDLKDATLKHSQYVQIVCDPNKCNASYVASFLNSTLGKLVLCGNESDTTLPSLSKQNVLKTEIALPSLEIQNQIADTSRKLKLIQERIIALESNIALNPLRNEDIGHIDSILEAISELAESDKIKSLIRNGESKVLEFKESLSWCIKTNEKKDYIEDAVFKTIGGFLNTDGGVLLVGVHDSGEIKGIEGELEKFHQGSTDKFLLHFKNKLKSRIGEQFYPFIDHEIVQVDGKSVFRVKCKSSDKEMFLDGKDFYVRTNPSTDKLEGIKLLEYVKMHWANN